MLGRLSNRETPTAWYQDRLPSSRSQVSIGRESSQSRDSRHLHHLQDFEPPAAGNLGYKRKSVRSSCSQKGFLGLEKGEKPARFNEELKSSHDTQSIAASRYLELSKSNLAAGGDDQRIKVNLRTIGNAKERDQIKMLTKHSSLTQIGIDGKTYS